MWRWIVSILIFVPILAPAYVAYGVWSMGFHSLREMDFDNSGSTTLSEITTALDVVKVPSREKPGCIDYLDAKAGTHVYVTRCPAKG
jgi:hypothetical protein